MERERKSKLSTRAMLEDKYKSALASYEELMTGPHAAEEIVITRSDLEIALILKMFGKIPNKTRKSAAEFLQRFNTQKAQLIERAKSPKGKVRLESITPTSILDNIDNEIEGLEKDARYFPEKDEAMLKMTNYFSRVYSFLEYTAEIERGERPR